MWLLVTPSMRAWLRRPAPWLGALLGVAVFLPVLLWNAGAWLGQLRRGRAGASASGSPADALGFLGELIGGQIGLVTPLVFVFCVPASSTAARQAWRTRDPAWTLLAALTLPGGAGVRQHALGDRVQGNWPAVIYPAAAIAAAD